MPDRRFEQGRSHTVRASVNGQPRESRVEPRTLLVDFLRDGLGLTGTHVGCEHGLCGACTVIVDGAAVLSCLMLAVQVEGSEIETVEGLAPHHGSGVSGPLPLSRLQAAFRDGHALQCGYCTPGILMAATALLRADPRPDEAHVRDALAGNLCRCTGYEPIVDAILAASHEMSAGGEGRVATPQAVATEPVVADRNY